MTAKVDVVIVNFNTGNLLKECLASLTEAQQAQPVFERVIVIDNASSDRSCAGIEAVYPPVRLIKNPDNRGFAAACNQGAQEGGAEYVLFLNPDARVYPDTVSRALSVFDRPEYSDVGIVGVPLLNEAGKVSVSCSRLPRLRGFFFKAVGLEGWAAKRGWSQPMREWAHDATREVEQVMGAFFLMPRRVFRQLQGFDESFFVYFEEVDLSARAREEGWKTLFFAETKAFHKGGGTSERIKAHRLFYSLRSRLLYAAKHFPFWAAWLLLPLTLLLEPFARTAQLAAKKDFAGLKALWRGTYWLWQDSPNWGAVWRDMRRERA